MHGALLGLFGLALVAGGAFLVALGGSPYYLLAGLGTIGSGVLAWRGDRRAVVLYALVLIGTALWALAERGTTGWPLFARLFLPSLLGVPFLVTARGNRLSWLAPVMLVLVTARVVIVPPLPDQSLPSLAAPASNGEWTSWGADMGGTRFSPLASLTPDNVAELRPAWSVHLGVPPDGKLGNLEVTPLMIGGRLFVCNNMSMVDALDPETGKRLWRFDPRIDVSEVQSRSCRGVAFVRTGGNVCPERILTTTLDAKLWALDATTGRPCGDFGRNGMVDLATGMGPIGHGYYYPTSAPAVVRGRVIVGGWVMDGQKTQSPPGVVRAYDVRSGAFAWAFDIGRPDDPAEPPAGKTYTLGSPNAWAPMSADEALGMVYVPTGNAGPDYFSAHRRAEFQRYASSVVALDAATGRPRWSFQTVHRDVWDYDVSSQPTLVDLPMPAGGTVPALIQPTKRGQLFVLDRRTGRPIKPVKELPAPQGGAPGERLSPTQPVSVGMPSLAGPRLSEVRMWGMTPLDQLYCRIRFRQARYDGEMTPPGLSPTIEYPGFMGALSWGGVAVDPRRGLLVTVSNRVPTLHHLLPRGEADALGLAPRGVPGAKPVRGYWPQTGTPYAAAGAGFLSPLGVPCSEPPFGLITAVDIQTGAVRWERPLGTARDSGPFGLRLGLPLPMGVPTNSGAMMTAGGLVFVAATQERTIRALSLANGRTLWSARLPAGGQSVPMTYRSPKSGRQFVVVAAGGKPLIQAPVGDSLVAFALPRE
ncbi:membrane-bound PQQ-dependent dehydrogenase, glucose/quinate/shikimate family [Sphingobium subterraneum]|uniref:membrane-bound PQQ-dependent dehydrogenase, glucose/quinate/shikimate family n=1 Tax=Sphingobium subterraneum TaxID=627688 RepID=UPI0031B58661